MSSMPEPHPPDGASRGLGLKFIVAGVLIFGGSAGLVFNRTAASPPAVEAASSGSPSPESGRPRGVRIAAAGALPGVRPGRPLTGAVAPGSGPSGEAHTETQEGLAPADPVRASTHG